MPSGRTSLHANSPPVYPATKLRARLQSTLHGCHRDINSHRGRTDRLDRWFRVIANVFVPAAVRRHHDSCIHPADNAVSVARILRKWMANALASGTIFWLYKSPLTSTAGACRAPERQALPRCTSQGRTVTASSGIPAMWQACGTAATVKSHGGHIHPGIVKRPCRPVRRYTVIRTPSPP